MGRMGLLLSIGLLCREKAASYHCDLPQPARNFNDCNGDEGISDQRKKCREHFQTEIMKCDVESRSN